MVLLNDFHLFCSWDNPDTPGMLAQCMRPIPAVEDSSVVHHVKDVHSPRLSIFSPITPDSGADSYTTAKTHQSSHIPTLSPTPRSHSQLTPGYLSPHCNSFQMVGLAVTS